MTATDSAAPVRLPRNPITLLVLAVMRVWQLVPRIDQQRCRFYPSCSAYGITAVQRFGVVRGGWLALRRLGRCHPWNPGGVDHVPARLDGAAQARGTASDKVGR